MANDDTAVPRIVLDSNVYVSAAIAGRGAPADLLEAALSGRAILVVSPRLLAEVREVLQREKFRQWITLDEVSAFLQALELVSETIEDPSLTGRRRVCRDPDDDYLVALAQEAEAVLLVSGDRDLLTLQHPHVDVRTPRDALDALAYEHDWGPALMPADADAIQRQIVAEGHDKVLAAASAFIEVLRQSNAAELLPHIVTPESLANWRTQLSEARATAFERGITSRPEYPSPDIAYVKLTPDPGENIKATANMTLPEGTLILTLQRRPELPDIANLGGWRIHAIGPYVPPEEMPQNLNTS